MKLDLLFLRHQRRARLGALVAVALLSCCVSQSSHPPLLAESTEAVPQQVQTRSKAASSFASLQVPFEKNAGQWPAEVAFVARTITGSVWVTRDGAVVHSMAGKQVEPYLERSAGSAENGLQPRKSRGPSFALVERFRHGALGQLAGVQKSSTNVSYLVGGDRSKWRQHVEFFEKVDLGDVWPSVGVDLHATGSQIEKFYHVRPGGSVAAIEMEVKGADRMAVAESGALVFSTSNGNVELSTPIAYQFSADGSRTTVPVKYTTDGTSGYGFHVGAYDAKRELIIDPILQGTLIGGASLYEQVYGFATDAGGNVYLAGTTQSPDFPGVTGGVVPTRPSAAVDYGYVAKLNPALTGLLQATYFGGYGATVIKDLLVEPSGTILLAGRTNCPSTGDAGLPGATGGAKAVCADGYADAFVSRLSSGLTTVLQSTYFGGFGADEIGRIVQDPAGNVYGVGGGQNPGIQGTTGGAQAAFSEMFVVKFSQSLTSVLRSSYVGAAGHVKGQSVALDAAGDVFLYGVSDASGNIPATAGGAAPAYLGGGTDFFITKMDSGLTQFEQSTYVGTSLQDGSLQAPYYGLVVDRGGSVYVAGNVMGTDLAGTVGGLQATPPAGTGPKGFVSKFSNDLRSLSQSTYFAASNGYNILPDMTLTAGGDVVIAGSGMAPGIPGYSSCGGDSFVAVLSPDLTSQIGSTIAANTYFGTQRVAAAANGNIYAAGVSISAFSQVAGGYQSTAHSWDPAVWYMTPEMKCSCTSSNASTVCGASPWSCDTSTAVGICVNGCSVANEATMCGSDRYCDDFGTGTAGHQCESKLANGVSLPSVAPFGGVCTSALGIRACAAGVCDTADNKCGYANGTGLCSAATAAAVCRSGFCSTTANVCIPATGCAADADCTGGAWCNISTFTCTAPSANGTPIPADTGHNGATPATSPVLNAVCTPASGTLTCAAGVCDTRDNLCGFDVGGASACAATTAAAVCRSGFCSTTGQCAVAGSCNTDGDCPTTAWCEISSRTCKPDVAQAGALPTDSGHNGSTPATSPVLNAVCTAQAAALVCISATCDAADNKCGLANGTAPSAPSAAATECRAGVASATDQKCGLKTGESCASATQCRSNSCLSTGKCDGDTDGDGVSDGDEIRLGTDPTKKDSDGDGVPDNAELSANLSGNGPFTAVDTDGDGKLNALDTDDDGDGLLTKDELGPGGATRPLDTDGDGNPDDLDADDDNDGISTEQEIGDGRLAGVNSDDVDSDGKKNWLDTDSDGDGMADADERGDSNNNGIPDYLEKSKPSGADAGPGNTDAGSGNTDASTPVVFDGRGNIAGGGLSCSAAPSSGAGLQLFSAFGIALGAALARLKRAA